MEILLPLSGRWLMVNVSVVVVRECVLQGGEVEGLLLGLLLRRGLLKLLARGGARESPETLWRRENR